jgi:hypothetical protein
VYLYLYQQLHTSTLHPNAYTMMFSLPVRAGMKLSGWIVNVLYRPR